MTDPLLIDIPERVEGPRIAVRAYRHGDGPALRQAVAESREHLRRWLPFADEHQSDEESELFVRRSRISWLSRENLGLVICRRSDERYLGGTGLHRIDWNARKFEIGYWIRASEAGKGYVTEAVGLVCDLAFGVLKANRVHIRCGVENERSCSVARRTGFRFEGVLRNDILATDGTPKDCNSFSKTPADWRPGIL